MKGRDDRMKRHPLAERREIELEVEAMLADDAIARRP